jgi:hypothetical protein
MPELIQTLKSMQKLESEKRKFLAMIQGIDLDSSESQNEGPTFEDIKRRALGIDANSDDIVSLQGQFAGETGFGVGAGLGYVRE